MQIVICEDEALYQLALTKAITHWKAASGHYDVSITIFRSSEELLESFNRKLMIDLLFLDIHIPGEMNGLELASKIRESSADVNIVFCTNYCEYVYQGYSVNALRFLTKPIMEEDIFFCCSYTYNRLALHASTCIFLRSGGKRTALRYMEILYIEVRSHNLFITTTVFPKPLRIAARLSDIQSDLPAKLFGHCHRSFIVNVAHIRSLTRSNCLLSNGCLLPVSRTYCDALNRIFDRYHLGGRLQHGLDSI